jgi:hypothetical protein
MKSGVSVVFSTGPTIPTLRITGTAFDWVAETPVPRALIEATTPDSVVYLAQSDSLGRFSVGPLNPGSYLVRMTVDQNQNHRADRSESFDTLRVVAPHPAPVELLAASRDTLPARITSATVVDSTTLRVVFDRLLDPTQQFPVGNFHLAGADSVRIAITAIRTPAQDAARDRARQQAAADSARRADSVAGRPRPPAQRPSAATPVDSLPKPSRTPPFTTLSLDIARPLAPGVSYRLRVTSIKALSGRDTGSERSFTTPKTPATRSPADSAARGGARPPSRP